MDGLMPSKSQAVPAPYYLIKADTPYCHSCGRVIGARRSNSSKASSTEVKYCSDKCKRHKPSTAPDSLDVRISESLAALLQGQAVYPVDPGHGSVDTVASVVKPKQPLKKGDPRIIVSLSELETAVFGDRKDPTKTHGRRKNRRPRAIAETGEWKSVDMMDPAPNTQSDTNDEGTAGSSSDDSPDDQVGGVSIHDHVRLSQAQSDVNFSVGGERGWAEKIEETPEMLMKRREGQKRADEKEQVKNAARRAVAFGLLVDAPQETFGGKKSKKAMQAAPEPAKIMRKCEALMNWQVSEPSFCKGDWSIRWRED